MDHLSMRQAYKRVRRNKTGYTLIELVVVMAIILILSTIGIFVYQRFIAHARGTVCKTNLKALETATEVYTAENDALPASLGDLKLEHLEKGYAKAMEDRRWLIKFYFFIVKLNTPKQVYAQFLTYQNLKTYGATEGIFHCPADPNGGISYGINGNLVGRLWSDVDMDELVIADSDQYVFTTMDDLAKRHRNKAFGVKRGGVLTELADEDDMMTICHKPGTPAEKTMTISSDAWPGHQGHGDTIGACSGD